MILNSSGKCFGFAPKIVQEQQLKSGQASCIKKVSGKVYLSGFVKIGAPFLPFLFAAKTSCVHTVIIAL